MNANSVRVFCLTPFLWVLLSGCQKEQPAEVFVPPGGDAERGKQVFVEYKCYNCHQIVDVELPQVEEEPVVQLTLGLRFHRVTSYGDLLTAILYPDHAVSPRFKSALEAQGKDPDSFQMPDFTEKMTISELIDLVEFLDEEYSRLLGTQYQSKDPRPRGRLRSTKND